MIATNKGSIPIKEISVGDYVKTPLGLRKVLNKFIYHVDKLIEVTTSKGNQLVCTENHKIFTDKSLAYADTLVYDDVIINDEEEGRDICQKYIGCLGGRIGLGFRDIFLSVNQKKEFSLTENPIHGTVSILKDQLDYIEMCGAIIMEKFQKITTSITLMAIPKIMTYQICNVYTNPRTYHWMQKEINGLEAVKIKDNLGKLIKKLKNGIQAQREKNGIQIMEKNHGSKENGLQLFVRYAEKKAKLLIKHVKQFALGIVKQSKDILKEPTMNLGYVKYAKNISQSIVTEKKEHVAKIVPLSFSSKQKVYDIEVEKDHCYFANGLLVSNSDAFRYLAVGLKGMESTTSGSVQNDLKAVNRYYGL